MLRTLAVLLIPVVLLTSNAHAETADTMNFRFSPVGIILGIYSIGMDFAIQPNWTLGPELTYIHREVGGGDVFDNKITIDGFGAGVRANWFANGSFTSGLYVGPSLDFLSVKADAKDSDGTTVTASASTTAVTCVVGYGWFWNPFNMMLGGGGTLHLGAGDIKLKDDTGRKEKKSFSRDGLALEYTLGWTF